jgi:uncharacterized linocin/CFP29 family protein
MITEEIEMENNYLGRDGAPIGENAWKAIDAAMAEAAKSVLAGRRLLYIEGPFGLGLKGVPLQDAKLESGLLTSSFVPLNLIQKNFVMSKRDLAAAERDGLPVNTAPVAAAALDCAQLEDEMIFHGSAGSVGLLTDQGASKINLSSWKEVGKAADDIIAALTALDNSGFHGPYSLALSSSRYNLLLRRYPQGGTELDQIKSMTDSVFKAPILENGGVLLASGRQYAAIILGQDMSVGFIGPTGENLEFYVSESLALLIRQSKAICVLK